MAQFESARHDIDKAGATVLFVAAEKRGGLFKPEKFLVEHPLGFPFLLDEDRRVTKEYGVYHRIGLDAYNIARPATLVVDGSGVIRFIHVGADQHDRVDLERVLAALRQLT